MLPPKDLDDPEWNEGGKVHNWKNHVPENVQAIWSSFTMTQKYELFIWAEELSDGERWN